MRDKELKEASRIFREMLEDDMERAQNWWSTLTYDQKLWAVMVVSHILLEHASEGGTYRYLIYDRFGFDVDAYAPLQWSGLLSIHNLISGKLGEEEKE